MSRTSPTIGWLAAWTLFTTLAVPAAAGRMGAGPSSPVAEETPATAPASSTASTPPPGGADEQASPVPVGPEKAPTPPPAAKGGGQESSEKGMSPQDLPVWRMATLLQIPFPLLKQGVEAFEQVYARRYDEARATFEALSREYPDAALGPFGMAVLAQAKMAENLDYSEDEAYQEAMTQVLERVEAAIDREESMAWNYFIKGTVLGMNSFYNFRKDRLLSAIKDGWVAISDMERARQLEPRFVDPILGVGLYNYWRSVVTNWFKNLPGFPDRRKEGLEQMVYARDHGVFAPPLARLSLAFSYYEGRRFDDALAQCLALQEAYPENIINLQILGRVYMRKRKYTKAEETLLQVLTIDPTNVQVHYALGYLYFYRLRDLEKARRSLQVVADGKPGTYYGEVSRVRLGDVYWLLGEHDRALALWRTAYERFPDLKSAELRVKKDWRPPTRPWRRQIAAAREGESNASEAPGEASEGGLSTVTD